MPLYIVTGNDHRQISTDDLARIMKIDKKIVEKIQKNPVFEINEKLVKPDKLNGGFIAPAGRQSKPRFFVKLDKNGVITKDLSGIRQEIRYALSIVPDRENERLSTYEPKRIRFEDLMDVVPNLELALFKYCMPDCKESPISSERNWYYTFQNKEAKAIKVTEHGEKIAKALAYLSNSEENGGLSDSQIVLTAKGIYAMNREANYVSNPSAKNKTIIEIKADLINFALKEVDLFLATIDDDVNEFYGMVLDAVDRGIFGIRKTTHSKSWYWEKGPQKGTVISEVLPSLNEFDVLKAAIEANPNAFYSSITRAVAEETGRDNMQVFLAKKKTEKQSSLNDPAKAQPSHNTQESIDPNEDEIFNEGNNTYDTPDDNISDDTFNEFLEDGAVFELPTGYEESVKLATLFNNGKRPHTTVLSQFWKECKAGNVTTENIKSLITKLVEENI